jgi:hypothetical protein
MAQPSHDNASGTGKTRAQAAPDQPRHLPDVLVAEDSQNIVDLPRQGAPREVVNLAKAPNRLPALLIDE